MAILTDSEERLRKAEEEKQHKKTWPLRFADWFFPAVLIISGVLVVIGIIASQPKATITGESGTSSQNAILARLRTLLAEDASRAAADRLRAKLGENDFAILTTPTAASTKANSKVKYSLWVVRGSAMRDDITLTATDLPATVTLEKDNVIVTGNVEEASLTLTVGTGAVVGSYSFTVKGRSKTLERITRASLIISDLTATNVVVQNVQPMAEGSKWQATITWDTDAPANALVEYAGYDYFLDHEQAYAYAATDQTNMTTHSVTLSYLNPDEVYHLRIKSVDKTNSPVYGTDLRFATAIVQ